MAKLQILKGSTSVLVRIFIQDSSSTTGAGLTGLVFNTSSLVCYRARDDDGNAGGTAISLATATLGTWATGGFKEKDATNMQGWYEFGITNASLATGSRSVSIHFKGATNMAPLALEIELTGFDNQSVTDGGLSKLTSLTFTGAGKVDASVRDWIGGTIPAVNVTGVPLVDAKYLLGTIFSTPTVAGIPNVNAKTWNDLATVALPLVPTTAGRTLDVSAGGEAGVDWANVGSPTTSLALTGTTIAVTQKVDVDTIKTNPVVNAGTITFPTTATLASTTNITAGTITTATTATNLTNAPTAGDFTATMKTSIGTAVAASAVASVTGNVGGNVTGSVGSVASGGLTRASFAADTGLQPIRSNTASAGGATTITLDGSASAVDSFYNNCIVYLTGGTGVGQARFVSAYVGATKVATVATWITNPDNTSTFAILPFDAIAGASAPTAAQNATAVWQDLLVSADFGTAGSIGKLLKDDITGDIYARLGAPAGASVSADIAAVKSDTGSVKTATNTGVAPGAAGGLFIAGTNAATSITTGLTAHLIGTVDTLTTYTGNTVQTGDGYALLNSTAQTELTSVPASTAALKDMIKWLFLLGRNKITQTSSTQLVRNNADGATVGTSTVSDDGTTATRGKFA